MFSVSRLLKCIQQKTPPQESLGLSLAPGDRHYRAYVGPPEDYDVIAAMTFNLLTTLGLRQRHKLLDVGCGSLRIGRLLIPYLNTGNYTGLEPNKWLVEEGIGRETGQDQIHIKKPQFHFIKSGELLPPEESYDFAVAQSIFSHCGPDLVDRWLKDISVRLKDSGALVATFLIGEQDCHNTGWIYPACVYYKLKTMEEFARSAGFNFLILNWKHPRQSWALYAKPGFDVNWFQDKALTWNAWLESAPK